MHSKACRTVALASVMQLIRVLSFVLILSSGGAAYAAIDWGGGYTRFADRSGDALERDTGCALLISVRAGQLIDFETFVPPTPSALLTPGTCLTEGANVNCVLAVSYDFYSGYLLNSAVPDLLATTQQQYGVTSGEELYLLVWDRQTFEAELPTDDSYFGVLPLYVEGQLDQAPAQTTAAGTSLFSQSIYPDASLALQPLDALAEYGGFNTYPNFASWLAALHGINEADSEQAKDQDSNGNGRSNLDEYVFDAPFAAIRVDESADVEADTADHSGGGRFQLEVTLRASDAQLTYALDLSDDLRTWRSVELRYTNQQWICTDEGVQIADAVYAGLGTWRVALLLEATADRSFFKFTSTL